MKQILSLFLLLLIMTSLYACVGNDDVNITTTITITFDTEGGQALDDLVVEKDTTARLPIPVKPGFNFIGWLDEEELHFTSADTVERDITLTAVYEVSESVNFQGYESNLNPVVTIEVKNYGVMQIELFPGVAPNTVNNFIHLVNTGYYDGLVFHRIIRNFMVQGGHNQDTTCAIEGEFGSNDIENDLRHLRGVISMARTSDPNSATGQFFIMHQNTPSLNTNYAAFGTLISGFNVLDSIASTPTRPGDAPQYEVLIATAYVETFGINYDEPVCYN